MDPVLLFAIGSFVFRRVSIEARKKAAEEYQSAAREYEQARQRAVQERQKCLELLRDLAQFRQAAMGSRWGRLHTLLIACGVNGGIFAPPRKIFGETTEQEVRAILADNTGAMLVKNRASSSDAVLMVSGGALLIRGISFMDAHGWGHLPFLHRHVHDVASAMDLGGVGDVLGPIGDLEIATALSGGLSILGLGISIANFMKADNLEKEGGRLHSEAEGLDEKQRELEALGHRIVDLCEELKAAAYELFKWTVVGEETARLRKDGRARRVASLPKWLLKGLLHKARELWRTIEKSPFPEAAAEGKA